MKIGPKYKICRRLGERIFPKCQTTKFTISGTEPVRKMRKHGSGSVSEYGSQLKEKQKVRYTYGLRERQFANYVEKAQARRSQNPVTTLYTLLETRLDNVVFRLGLAPSRLAARQLTSHGHITVNGKKVTIPSYQVKSGDEIEIRKGSHGHGSLRDLAERLKDYEAPEWLVTNLGEKKGLVKGQPLFKESESTMKLRSIIEFYSRV